MPVAIDRSDMLMVVRTNTTPSVCMNSPLSNPLRSAPPRCETFLHHLPSLLTTYLREVIVGITSKMRCFIMNISLKYCSPFPVLSLALAMASITGCHKVEGNQPEPEHHTEHKILVTSPVARDVVRPQPFVSQIHSADTLMSGPWKVDTWRKSWSKRARS